MYLARKLLAINWNPLSYRRQRQFNYKHILI
nr:MAG TPA: hypothetical protein [Caudoviricetes sp.]